MEPWNRRYTQDLPVKKRSRSYLGLYFLAGMLLSILALDCYIMRYGHSVYSSKWNPVCWRFECNNEKWILYDVHELRFKLEGDLFGQHMVQYVIYRALAFPKSHKPLSLSFHGATGTGKNYVSQMIARSRFYYGMDSKYVHFLSGTKDFPINSMVEMYKIKIQQLIEREKNYCQHSMFIFDEIDSFPPGLLNSIQKYLEDYEYRNTIFLFLSNTGCSTLTNITEEYFQRGRHREDISLEEIVQTMLREIYDKEDARSSRSRLIKANLISHFVPFLPLEKSHVSQCIWKELTRRQIYPSKNLVDEVIDNIQFHGLENNFSVKGCKNVAEVVSYVLRLHDEL